MPEPPASSVLTRWVLENPWPTTGVLVVAAIVMIGMGLRDGRRGPLQLGAIIGVISGAILAIGMRVVTAGEEARRVTTEFVTAVEAGDVLAADRLLASNASLAMRAPTNPGFPRDFIIESLDRATRYEITSNSASMDAYTEDDDLGVVHLTCRTDVDGWAYPTPSSWVVRVRRIDDAWLIDHITCVSIAGQTPDARGW